ncbi:MAG: aspartate-semialdehyde dehydrogenase [Bacteroidetes bacterium]|nr:aspartate-semialdehyde dehydrogenase [Bacteroidota bacterium]MBU2637034.1 aspartate-semialdehyde dehydrogenase [Bacteroidota bacterium]
MKLYDVAIVGATGLVGRKIIEVLEKRNFPVGKLRLLATDKSLGAQIDYKGKTYDVEKLTPDSFKGYEFVFFSAGGPVSKEYAPIAVRSGALVIDNSSFFRMEESVPLVVPEVNPKQVLKHKGIIANPNCSTIQMVVVLKPLHDRWKIKRIVVATYQAVTGAGQHAINQLEDELQNVPVRYKKFPHPIAYNCLPHIDIFYDHGYTREECKMVNETKKIMEDPTLKITATCVRVPTIGGHSEAVNVEFEKHFEISEVKEALRAAPGIVVQDNPQQDIYPMPIWAHNRDEVFVGRIRKDETVKNGLNLWIVSDNLRKGAATNAVQIAEEYILRKGS